MRDVSQWSTCRRAANADDLGGRASLLASRDGRPRTDDKYSVTHSIQTRPVKKSTTPVSRLYIAPAILIAPLDSISASTGLSLRMLATVISTFFRATV